MNEKRFIKSLISSALDRIESSVPPCVTPEESVEPLSVNYRHGILELVGATLQDLYSQPLLYSIHDFLTVIGLHQAVERWVNARLADPNTKMPDVNPMVETLFKRIEESNV